MVSAKYFSVGMRNLENDASAFLIGLRGPDLGTVMCTDVSTEADRYLQASLCMHHLVIKIAQVGYGYVALRLLVSPGSCV